MVAVAPKQIINSLKSVVASVFKDGVDQILSWPQIDMRGYLTFRFRGGREVYDCEISPDGTIGYVETQRGDSALLGAYFGSIAQYIEDSEYAQGLIESEITRIDGKKCKVGLSCGSTCITKSAKCTQQLGLKQKQAVKNIREAVSQKAKPTDNTGRNIAIAAGIGATVLAGGAIAGGVMLFGGKGGGNEQGSKGVGEQGGNTAPTNPTSPTNPPEPDVPSPPRSRNIAPSSTAGALPPGKPPQSKVSKKPPIAQPQNSVIEIPPAQEKQKPTAPDRIVDGVEIATNAIKKTFSQELQDTHKLQISTKEAPSRGVKAAIIEGAKAAQNPIIGGVAGGGFGDLLDGSFDDPVGVIAKTGVSAGAIGITKTIQSLKTPTAKDLTPSVDFATKTIHISEASKHPDLDTIHGFGQYLHRLGMDDPKKATEIDGFVNGVIEKSNACKKLSSFASPTNKDQNRKNNAEFLLQKEQVFGRLVTQYTSRKQKLKQKVIGGKAKSGEQWEKDDFDIIEKEMDAMFSKYGWKK